MKIKTQQTLAEAGLCATCRNGLVRRDSDSDLTIYCSIMGPYSSPVYKPIVQCTDYDDRRQESEHEMRKIAWTLRTEKGGKIVGFQPPPEKKEDF